jgi:hypothetical protein
LTWIKRSLDGRERAQNWWQYGLLANSGRLRRRGGQADAYRILTATERRATLVNIDIIHEAQMSLIHHVITGSGRPSIEFVHGLPAPTPTGKHRWRILPRVT